jgi:hypothetical protein
MASPRCWKPRSNWDEELPTRLACGHACPSYTNLTNFSEPKEDRCLDSEGIKHSNVQILREIRIMRWFDPFDQFWPRHHLAHLRHKAISSSDPRLALNFGMGKNRVHRACSRSVPSENQVSYNHIWHLNQCLFNSNNLHAPDLSMK